MLLLDGQRTPCLEGGAVVEVKTGIAAAAASEIAAVSVRLATIGRETRLPGGVTAVTETSEIVAMTETSAIVTGIVTAIVIEKAG